MYHFLLQSMDTKCICYNKETRKKHIYIAPLHQFWFYTVLQRWSWDKNIKQNTQKSIKPQEWTTYINETV